MKFKLSETYRYWWPVTVRVPDPENAGQFINMDLRLQLEPQSREEFLRHGEEGAELTSLRDMVEHDTKQALRVIRNWDGVIDDDGDPVPFTPELLRQALQHRWFRDAVDKALKDSQNGEAARVGN